MKKLLTLAFLLVTSLGFTQENSGIQFTHNLNWEQIKAKAKAENKYIFVDAFTTWCGPCKRMSKEIFPLKNVGDFYNANFINVKVQMDSTKGDSPETKTWYADAREIAKNYGIHAYPTYIFLSPDGELMHRAVGSSPAEQFIAKGKDALNPEKQYYGLKRQYEAGKKDPEFLFKLANAANEAYERDFIPLIAKEYLSTQKELNKPEVIKMLPHATRKSSDPGFAFLLNNSAMADSVLGKGASSEIVRTIIMREKVYPQLRSGETTQEASTVLFSGGLKKDVDWSGLEKDLKVSYPQLSDELMLSSRKMYYELSKDYLKFTAAMDEYLARYPDKVDKMALNNSAWRIFQRSDDPAALKSALAWSKKTLEGETAKEVMYMDTYANLLYKTGKKEEAIALETEAVKLSGEKNENGGLHQVLNKMKKGEKTW